MVASLISIMFIMKAINAQEQYALAAEDRCFDAKAYAAGYEFSPPYDGEIIGVKLQHKSGLVTCGGHTANSFWGCGAFPTRIYIEMIKHDATTITYYPTATTDGISSLNTFGSNCDCSVIFYLLSGYGGGSAFIELRDSDNLQQVSTSDTFSIQYGEGCCGYATGDNDGAACADVYFIYSEPITDPSNEPSTDPTSDPTTDPSSGPAPNPSEGPTRNYLTTTSDGEGTQLMISIAINSCMKPQDEESNCNITKNSVNEILIAYLDPDVQISSVVLVDNTVAVILFIPMSEYRTELDKDVIAKEIEAAFEEKYDDVDVTVEYNENEDSKDINDLISDLMADGVSPFLAMGVMIGVLFCVCFVCYFCCVRKKKRKATDAQDMMQMECTSAAEHTQQATNAQTQSNQVDLQSIISTRAKLQ
eukprot:380879_1